MIFTFRGSIELDEDVVDDLRLDGEQDTAIMHDICLEIQGREKPWLTDVGILEFTECQIKTEKEKEILPF